MKTKTALITGASRGIGAATAKLLAKNGIKVAINYRENENAAKRVLEEIESAGGEAITIKADVSNRAEFKAMVDTCLDRFGQINYLVNNAGIIEDAMFKNISDQQWDRVMDVNLRGVFIACQEVLKHMQEDDCVVNVSSVLGHTGNIGQANYSASKAAVFGLTKSLAKEYGGKGIRINCVAPGLTQTDMADRVPEHLQAKFLETVPLKKIAKPEDIAQGILFLLQNQYITGEILNINGGLY